MEIQTETLEQHLTTLHRRDGGPTPEVAALIRCVASAGRALSREIRRSALTGNVGLAGDLNPTGEEQKKLDVVGNKAVLDAFDGTGLVAAAVSEEMEEARRLSSGRGRYILCTDPLDGSSNTDINGAVGTIFGVYERKKSGPVDRESELLRTGSEQVLAGYVMYGPSTVLVFTAGNGVHGYTLDLDRDEWLLSHESIHCPPRGPYYSANLARYHDWHPGIQRFITSITHPDRASRPGSRSWSLRYTGALVADLHRSLVDGGIYFYPSDPGHKNGKLRLLYECAPLAFVVEQAGGRASTGSRRILDVRAESLHQRIPFVIGSAEDVALYESFFGGETPG
jgi:fructose-1,6-bisphosphatase I